MQPERFQEFLAEFVDRLILKDCIDLLKDVVKYAGVSQRLNAKDLNSNYILSAHGRFILRIQVGIDPFHLI